MYIGRRYLDEKFSSFKTYMNSALEKDGGNDLSDVLTRGELYNLRMYIIAMGKEMGMPFEDNMAKVGLEELKEED